MTHTRKASIYHNGKKLDLEIVEYKTLFKAYVIDETKWCKHVSTLRVMKYNGMDYTRAVFAFRDICINKKYF